MSESLNGEAPAAVAGNAAVVGGLNGAGQPVAVNSRSDGSESGGEERAAPGGGRPSVTPIDPRLRAEARRLVEGTIMPQADIALRLGLRPSTISAWKKRENWSRPPGAPGAPDIGGSRPGGVAGRKIDRPAARRKRMVERLYRTFELQVAGLGSRAANTATRTEEKDARTLGTLARTLETLMALERDEGVTAKTPEPVDRGAYEAELARRIRQWAEEGEGPETSP